MLVDRSTELLRSRGSLDGESVRRPLDLRGRLFALGRDVAEIEIGRVEQLELAGRAVARREHVGNRGAVFLLQAKQQVAALLDGGQPFGVGLDLARVAPRRLRQLRRARDRRIEQLLPLGDRKSTRLNSSE